ncbi:MAG: S-layer homology domain-containing protein [Clostridia bacterium]|nr:S-layer homology domain-containing protein [Clostridia bacterium]
MKKIISILLVLVLSLSMITITYADDMAIGLMVRSLSEKIVPGETFKVILFANSDNYPIYSYQFKINFDNTYFRLDDVYSSVNSSYEGLKVIDNDLGTATFSAFINGAQLTENNNDNNYKIATIEFETLREIDENKTISFDGEETVFLNQAGLPLDTNLNDLEIEIPQAPTKKSPTKDSFVIGDYAKFASATKDADIYYTTTSGDEPTTKMTGTIRLTKNVTFYVVAKKYGIESNMSTFKLSLKKQSVPMTGGGNTSVTPAPETTVPETPTKYADIQQHWAKDNIIKLINKGMVSGYEDGSVKPDNQITRQEIAKLIVSALNVQPTDTVNLEFTDSGEIADWAKGYVQTAVNLGILNGYDDGTFKPAQAVSRKELAKIAMVAFKYEQVQEKLEFHDEQTIPAWAYGYVSTAVKNGIITGYEDGTFMPDKNVTRAETCTILVKCLKI